MIRRGDPARNPAKKTLESMGLRSVAARSGTKAVPDLDAM